MQRSVLSSVAVLKGSPRSFQGTREIKTIFIIVCLICFFLCVDIFNDCAQQWWRELGALAQNQSSGTKLYRSNCILHHYVLGAKKVFPDKGVKTTDCIISLPLSTCLFIILCDKMRRVNTIFRKNTCVIVVSSTSGLFHSIPF